MPNRKLLSAAVLAASITGGGAVGVVLGAPALTSAQESDGTDSTTTTEAPDTTTTEAPDATTTEAPDATTTEAPEDCEGRGPGGGSARGFGRHFMDPAVAADALGITEEELRDAVDADTSIADLAAEKGVDVQAIIDALVADATADIDEAVAAGDLDAERAAEIEEGLTERVTAFVEGTRPEGRPGGFGRHHGEKPGADDTESDAAEDSTESESGS
jgi:hypothetical protein